MVPRRADPIQAHFAIIHPPASVWNAAAALAWCKEWKMKAIAPLEIVKSTSFTETERASINGGLAARLLKL